MKFLIENFLLLSTTRQVAEIGMYRLVIAIKDQFMVHPMVHTFARMLSLVDGKLQQNNENNDGNNGGNNNNNNRNNDQNNNKNSNNSPDRKLNNRSKENDSNSVNNTKKLILSDCAIPLPICTVYLYARTCLLRDYTGMLQYRILQHWKSIIFNQLFDELRDNSYRMK